MIYAVEIIDRMFVKIGFCKADDAQIRISTLQTGNPFQIKIITLTEGSLMQEKTLHSSLRTAFSRIRVPMPPNEWYPGRHDFMRKFVDALMFGPNQALLFSESYTPTMNLGRRTAEYEPNVEWPLLTENGNRKRARKPKPETMDDRLANVLKMPIR